MKMNLVLGSAEKAFKVLALKHPNKSKCEEVRREFNSLINTTLSRLDKGGIVALKARIKQLRHEAKQFSRGSGIEECNLLLRAINVLSEELNPVNDTESLPTETESIRYMTDSEMVQFIERQTDDQIQYGLLTVLLKYPNNSREEILKLVLADLYREAQNNTAELSGEDLDTEDSEEAPIMTLSKRIPEETFNTLMESINLDIQLREYSQELISLLETEINNTNDTATKMALLDEITGLRKQGIAYYDGYELNTNE